jgi:4-amino-4-deoxy-L-arabinose transferase-like glycosyltransferase
LDSRLHPDEALYGYWGQLIVGGRDPWLADVPVYKPPLLPYLTAAAEAVFGNSELALRLPGLIAGLVMIPLVAGVSRSLYRGRGSAVLAAAAVALSPFAILFSATAFPDLPMILFGLAGVAVVNRGRPLLGGVLLGLSFAAKQTGLMWLPVALWLVPLRGASVRRHRLRPLWSWGFIVALSFLWDAVRTSHGAVSFWTVGVSGYGGLRLIWPHELWPRLRGWADLARYLFVSPVVGIIAGASLLVMAWSGVTGRGARRERLADLLLVSFVLVYLLLHWLCAFPVWDRYLLPLVPVLALGLGRLLQLAASATQLPLSRATPVALGLLALLLAAPAAGAAHGAYPVGGDHGTYDGIDLVATFLSRLPEGTVVYHHWLGWHFAHHLFDAPVYQAYWPTPAWLARDVLAFGGREPRYVVFPSWESSGRVEHALSQVNYGLRPEFSTERRDGTHSFTVYRIVPLRSY